MDWKPDEKKVEHLRGIVIPSEWGVDDEVTVVSIVTEDNTEYMVSEARMVRRLMKHMDEAVEVDGFLGEDEYGEETLVVGHFTPCAADADEEDFDDLEDDFEDDEDVDEEEEDDEEFESYTLRRRTAGLKHAHQSW